MSQPYASSEDHQPVTWLHGHAIYAAHLVVLVFVASMVGTTIVMALDADQAWFWLPFSSDAVLRGEVWRIFTYGLWNLPGIWFAIDMVMIVWFGRELEKFFGRRSFLLLFGCLYLLSPALFTLIGVWKPMTLSGETGAFALFIAFATLYPHATLFFGVLAKWLAAILVGIYTLMALSRRDTVGLISLFTTVGFAFAYVRYHQGRLALPGPGLLRSTPVHRPSRNGESRIRQRLAPGDDSAMADMDALLDKIATSGIESLTPREKARLDAARERIVKRRSRSG